MTIQPRGSDPEQWDSERTFADAVAASAGEFNLEKVARRYESAMSRPLYPLEVAYALLGDIRGKRILDVGCGNGENSLLFARWGADVTGVDISPGAVAVATSRARALGLSKNAQFIEMPFERVSVSHLPFDIVWSAAFLHHVLDRLPEVLQLFEALLKPDGFVLFSEPVRFSQSLKRLRALLPPYAVGTPEERPLESPDLGKIESAFRVSDVRLFGPVSRACDRWGPSGSYEDASPQSRRIRDTLYRVDEQFMGVSLTRFTAMIMVARLGRKTSKPR